MLGQEFERFSRKSHKDCHCEEEQEKHQLRMRTRSTAGPVAVVIRHRKNAQEHMAAPEAGQRRYRLWLAEIAITPTTRDRDAVYR